MPRKNGEKIRQQVNKLAAVAKEKGYPEPQLRRAANDRGDIDSVFQNALAQVDMRQTSSQPQGTVAPTSGGLVGGGIPLVPAGMGTAVGSMGGLIPVPPGS